MPIPLTDQDERYLAEAAEFIHRTGREADRANQELRQLQGTDDATLQAVVNDPSANPFSRLSAVNLLAARVRRRPDGDLSALLLPLWDDPDDQVARAAVEMSDATDPEVASRLLALLDDPRHWSNAASAFARRKVASVVPRLLDWFRNGDRAHRNVAWSSLVFQQLLAPEARLALLREAWEAGGRDDDDRAMLAVGLLNEGDRSGWPFLVDLARRADTYSAVWAVEVIGESDPALGLDLTLHILDQGATFRVRWGMVERVAQSAGLPHCWTADGLAEARHWVEQRRAETRRG